MWIWLVEYGCYAKLESIQETGYINNKKDREINKHMPPSFWDAKLINRTSGKVCLLFFFFFLFYTAFFMADRTKAKHVI